MSKSLLADDPSNRFFLAITLNTTTWEGLSFPIHLPIMRTAIFCTSKRFRGYWPKPSPKLLPPPHTPASTTSIHDDDPNPPSMPIEETALVGGDGEWKVEHFDSEKFIRSVPGQGGGGRRSRGVGGGSSACWAWWMRIGGGRRVSGMGCWNCRTGIWRL